MQRTPCPSGKIRHATRDDAHAHIVSLKRDGKRSGETTAYKCDACGGWHVGRRIKSRLNAEKRKAARRVFT